jgi:hypothetical protein
MKTLASLIVFSASVSALSAQWPNHPTPGVPRTPDGKPNLSAPAPRTADGKPELSGVWRFHKSYLLNAAPDLKPQDIQPWAATVYKKSADNYRNDTDGINCLPPGPKTATSVGPPVKIVQTPGLVILLYEYQTLFRQVFTDGRELPKDPNPTWMGYSVGHWEGDTLVVDTVSMRDDTPYDRTGAPHSDKVHLVERMRLVDPDTFENDMTIEDPVAFTRPWHVNRRYRRIPADTFVSDVVCNETQHSPIVNGQTQFLLPNDPPGYVVGPMPVAPKKP